MALPVFNRLIYLASTPAQSIVLLHQTNHCSAPKNLQEAAASYAMGKTTILKAELGQSKSSSSASAVPNSYEVWQEQQGSGQQSRLSSQFAFLGRDSMAA